jgi:DnaJ-domain-containing protein 1
VHKVAAAATDTATDAEHDDTADDGDSRAQQAGWTTSVLPSYNNAIAFWLAPLDPATSGVAALVMLTGLLLSYKMVRNRHGRPIAVDDGPPAEPMFAAEPADASAPALDPGVQRSLAQALLVGTPITPSPFDLPLPPLAPDPAAGAMPAKALAADDDAWTAVLHQHKTALELFEIVRQIVETLMPEGPMCDVLRVDLHSAEQRLFSPQLAHMLAEREAGPAGDALRQILVELERVRTISRIEHERAMTEASRLGAMPETVAEAFAFLGVNPSADDRLVKKAVDALRQNWHPDQASDENDRHLREARIRQINTAWDLIRAASTVA